jgi:hypothetical protein
MLLMPIILSDFHKNETCIVDLKFEFRFLANLGQLILTEDRGHRAPAFQLSSQLGFSESGIEVHDCQLSSKPRYH